MTLRRSLATPIPAIFEAAENLRLAADAHKSGDRQAAEQRFLFANDPAVRAFTEFVWGSGAKARHGFLRAAGNALLPISERPLPRMPTPAVRSLVLQRDGYHCRFCKIPVIPTAVRKWAHSNYPDSVPWGTSNIDQHAAFQCMWLQFDHVLPNSRGGTSDEDNIVVTCAPCNFGRMETTLEEASLFDPRLYPVMPDWHGAPEWDGLEYLAK